MDIKPSIFGSFNPKEIFMYALGAFIVGCAVGTIVLMVFYAIPTANHDAIMLSVGALLGYAGSVVSYFYGSSKGSSDKTELINKAQENKA